jgi:hypothetical protein
MIVGPRYWSSPLGSQDRQEFLQRFPSLRFCREADGAMFVRGSLEVVPSTSYSINLLIPRKYPHEVPTLYCDRNEIAWEADRHVYENSGIACLCAPSEFRKHWPSESRLTLFFERLIIPFLAGQFYYQTQGVWPDTGQRSHGPKGILEAYKEMAEPLGDTSIPTLLRLMMVLARDNRPKGHEACPCGRGKILRKCHVQVLRKLRMEVQPEHAQRDLEYLQQCAWRSRAGS